MNDTETIKSTFIFLWCVGTIQFKISHPLVVLFLLYFCIVCMLLPPLTLGQAESTIHPKSHQSVRLSAINHRVISPQAQPVVGEQRDQVVGEE